jgi:NAD(P)-dependent dehydrogenase (short-subunit alcohol dehydrogenase family)
MVSLRYAEKYGKRHENPQGAGDSRPTAARIIDDEDLVSKLCDKVILITGCSSGIGIETARALSKTGATLYLTARDIPKAEKALDGILEPGRVELVKLDLSSLAAVREGTVEFLSKSKKLNILICNAGVMAVPSPGTTTADGFETQFGVNHLAHFLLFNLLCPTLLASSTPSFNSRVVMVSSSGHRNGGIRFGNYGFKTPGQEEYSPFAAYSQSKTANIYMANYIDRTYGSSGLHATSLMPGGIATELVRHVNPEYIKLWEMDEGAMKGMKNPEQGAATTVLAAVGREFEGIGGVYLDNCQEAGRKLEGGGPTSPGWADHAFDKEKEERLWRESLKMVGFTEA